MRPHPPKSARAALSRTVAAGIAGLLAFAAAFAPTVFAPTAFAQVPSSPGSASQDIAAGTPAAPGGVAMRSGDHPDFGRVVFDLPRGAVADVVQTGDRVVVHFMPELRLLAVPRLARNLRSIEVLPDGVALTLVAGARLRQARLGDRLLLDAVDADVATPSPATTRVPPALPRPPASRAAPVGPSGATATQADPAPAAGATSARTPSGPGAVVLHRSGVATTLPPDALERNDTPPADDHRPTRAQAPVETRPSEPIPTNEKTAPTPMAPGPGSLIARAVPPAVPGLATRPPQSTAASMPARMTGRTILLPFSAGTAAAAFRRGDAALVVFDERKPVDMSALREDPLFAGASVTLLAAATVLRLPLARGDAVRLAPVDGGWTVGIVAAGQPMPALRPIRPEMIGGRMRFGAEWPGQVVAVPDPLTGAVILVGTQTQPGQGMPVERRTPEFTILQTWQGVAVLPAADTLSLRVMSQGFVLGVEPDTMLALSAPEADVMALSDASTLSRQYDFPPVPVEGLLRRLQSATVGAATAPVQSRTALRLVVAQAMIALGMGAEAQSVMMLAGVEDGRVAANADAVGLHAIAALLAGRVSEADGLDDPRLTGSDEVAMWRAIRTAMRDEFSPQAAPVFAATLKLLQSYPQPLRDRLAPLVVETMALGGERQAAAAAVAAWPEQRGLDLARAMISESTDPALALELYGRLENGSDRRNRARASTRAAELRLATGAASRTETADALDRSLYAWRGDGRELASRLRIAELRGAAGQPRRALALLRETLQFWPESAEPVRSALVATFSRAVAGAVAGGDANQLPPLELVAIAEENPDLLPDGEEGRALAAVLAGRLLALDLPARAIPVLETLAEAAAPGSPARAELGSKLGQARLQQGDNAGALAALSMSMMLGQMPLDLLEDRTLTYARAAAATGQVNAAQQSLAALGTPAAQSLRASLLEAARDWKGAAAALGAVVADTVPAEGTVSATQAQLLLRFAGAAAQAGDDAMLAELRERYGARLPPGGTAEMFRLVTASPVRAVADLPRAAQEARLARSVADAAGGRRPGQ